MYTQQLLISGCVRLLVRSVCSVCLKTQLLTHHTLQSWVQTVTLMLMLDQTQRQRRLIIVSVFFFPRSEWKHFSCLSPLSRCRWEWSPGWVLNTHQVPPLNADATDAAWHHPHWRSGSQPWKRFYFVAKCRYFGSDIVYLLNRWRRERDQPVCLWWVNMPVSPTLRWPWCIVTITAKVTILPLCSPTSADYESLRIGGLGLAVVLFTLGILLILSEFTCLCPYVLLFCSPTFMVITSDCDSDVYFVVL